MTLSAATNVAAATAHTDWELHFDRTYRWWYYWNPNTHESIWATDEQSSALSLADTTHAEHHSPREDSSLVKQQQQRVELSDMEGEEKTVSLALTIPSERTRTTTTTTTPTATRAPTLTPTSSQASWNGLYSTSGTGPYVSLPSDGREADTVAAMAAVDFASRANGSVSNYHSPSARALRQCNYFFDYGAYLEQVNSSEWQAENRKRKQGRLSKDELEYFRRRNKRKKISNALRRYGADYD